MDDKKPNEAEVKPVQPVVEFRTKPKGVEAAVTFEAAKPTDTIQITVAQLNQLHSRLAESEKESQALIALTMFLRDNYYLEIKDKAPQHQTTQVDAAIYYLGIERRRFRVRLRYIVDAILKFGRS